LREESPTVNRDVDFCREGSFGTPFLPHCFNALGMVPMASMVIPVLPGKTIKPAVDLGPFLAQDPQTERGYK
jgi:hypothetical protein